MIEWNGRSDEQWILLKCLNCQKGNREVEKEPERERRRGLNINNKWALCDKESNTGTHSINVSVSHYSSLQSIYIAEHKTHTHSLTHKIMKLLFLWVDGLDCSKHFWWLHIKLGKKNPISIFYWQSLLCVCVYFYFRTRRNSENMYLHSVSLLCGEISSKSLFDMVWYGMVLDDATVPLCWWRQKKNTAFTAIITWKKPIHTHTRTLHFRPWFILMESMWFACALTRYW